MLLKVVWVVFQLSVTRTILKNWVPAKKLVRVNEGGVHKGCCYFYRDLTSHYKRFILKGWGFALLKTLKFTKNVHSRFWFVAFVLWFVVLFCF